MNEGMGNLAPFGLRLPPDLKDWVAREAKANRRSMNSEILLRLEESRRVSGGAQIGVQGPAADEHRNSVDALSD